MRKIIFISVFVLTGIFDSYSQVDEQAVENVVNEWNRAHNEHNANLLTKLYAGNVLFYCKDLPNYECVKIKSNALRQSPNFKQSIVSKIEITNYDSEILKCDFTKEVLMKGGTKDFEAYLLIKNENGNYLIVGEGDRITDENLNYHLNLGKQIDNDSHKEAVQRQANYSQYYILFGVIILLLIVVIYLARKKSKVSEKVISADESQSKTVTESEKSTVENLNTNAIITDMSQVSDTNEEVKTTKEYFDKALTHTTTAITKFFDLIDGFDRFLYGKKMRFFILGSILVMIIAPLLDLLLDNIGDWFTFYSTLAFFIFNLVLFLSFISSWRDDNGNWSFQRAQFKIKTYFENARDTVETTKATPLNERLYKLGQLLFFGGIGWKALHNISVFIRKPLEFFHFQLLWLKDFEKFTHQYSWIPILIGFGIIAYLYYQNPTILHRIKNELRQLFGLKFKGDSRYASESVSISKNIINEFVINAKAESQTSSAIDTNNSNLFNDFAIAIKNWNPRSYDKEYKYRDKLADYLSKHLPDATVNTEKPIGDKSLGNRGRADIVVDDKILIELKRDSSSGAIQRAKGQIFQYSEIWKGKGLVVLLLCDYDYEHARLVYSSTMEHLANQGMPALTIVAKPKKAISK